MDSLTIYIVSFTLGISSSLHCLGMCGPLVMAMSLGEGQGRWWQKVQYFFGKTLSYAMLGAVMGVLGWGAYALDWQQSIAIISGVILILVSLLPFLKFKKFGNGFQLSVTRAYSYFFGREFGIKFLILGFLNGLLPCGMVYVALTTAVVSNHPINGALAMAAFGLGTIPSLLAVTLLKTRLNRIPKTKFQYVSTICTILVGVFMILRGASLGIPYISPDIHVEDTSVKGCCAQ